MQAGNRQSCIFVRKTKENPVISDWVMELMTRIELVNLILTKEQFAQ